MTCPSREKDLWNGPAEIYSSDAAITDLGLKCSALAAMLGPVTFVPALGGEPQ